MDSLGIYSKDINNIYPSRPLSSEENLKNTFVLGEGAASFVIQNMTKEEMQTTDILARIDSVGYGFENPPSLTGISAEGAPLKKSMKMALKNMETPNDIDLILLHAPGTIQGDKSEFNAIKSVFGNNCPALFSNKWIVGHTFAASGLLNLELAIMCINNGFVPEFPYPVSINNNFSKPIKKVMINATGFGGNAMTLIVSKI